TMAYIEGTSLAERLDQRGTPYEPREAVCLIRTLAQALDQAHRAGIIHRDLKPSNIMLNREGQPIVADFGLARRNDTGVSLPPPPGRLRGPPAYMSLEQFRGEAESGPSGDIYSLGVILYQLVTDRLPFEGNPATVLEKLLTSEPNPPSSIRP